MTTSRPRDAAGFIEALTRRVAPLRRDLHEESWLLATTGDGAHLDRVKTLAREHDTIFADADALEMFRAWDSEVSEAEPRLRRQTGLLRLAFEAGRQTPEHLERMVELGADLYAEFTNFRPVVGGRPAGFNDVVHVLRTAGNAAERRSHWEASKEIGARVESRLREMVRLRNETARAGGYPDFHTRSLALHELDPTRIDEILADLERRTRDPFAEVKEDIDASLARRFGIAPERLRPWHYPDPFFQDLPAPPDLDIARIVPEIDPVDLARRSFDAIGLPIDAILDRSDLFERRGKEEHAFCMDMDAEGDVRVLANLRNDLRSVGTMLHEMGHAVYSFHVDRGLPYFLRGPAHSAFTEAVAMLIPKRLHDARWLVGFAGAPRTAVETMIPGIREHRRRELLVFVRWALVVCRFEQAMYADPDRDLNRLWWDLVERFQLVRRPDGRDAPDWAAKTHIANHPAYYQNYLLGEMIAAQLEERLAGILPAGNLIDAPEMGAWLIDEIFRPGRSVPWEDLLERSTGRRLDAKPLLKIRS